MKTDKSYKEYVPPNDAQAEKAVLGSVMLRGGALYEITDTLVPDSFYSEKNKALYRLMLELSQRGDPLDLVSITSRAKEKKTLESIGGATYLTSLVEEVPTSANIKHYAGIVHKKFLLRSLIESAREIDQLARDDGGRDVDDILNKAEQKIFAVSQSQKHHKFVSIKQALAETWDELEHLHANKGELRGIPTGFRDLDKMLAGLQRSDLIILAARPSVGKTTLALDIARQTATKHNMSVGIFSLEMSASQLTQRMLAAESQVSAWNLRTGNISSDREFSVISEALDRLAKAKIYIDDKAANTIVSMRSVARRWMSEYGLDMIIVDYLQLMASTKDYDSMVNQVTEISRSLKQLARELNVPVLALSQLSRAVEARGGRPRLSDLRDSGSIEQDADVVMFLHREDKYKEQSEKTNIVEVLIEKHRNGPTGMVELFFDGAKTTYLSIEKHYEKSGIEAPTNGAVSVDNF